MTKKIICFSLWGNHEFYNYGALENAIIAKEIYPDWKCRFYYLDNCDIKIINELKKMDNVEMILMEGENNYSNMFWRFIPAFNENDIILLSRDTDSRLNLREKYAVDEWLKSDKDFHIMRDHKYHTTEILGGMWGCRNNILHPLKDIFNNFYRNNAHGWDQQFLKNCVYPFVVNNSLIHASHYKLESNCKDFTYSLNKDFIGSYIRTAPFSFKLLNEPERLLNVNYPHQANDY